MVGDTDTRYNYFLTRTSDTFMSNVSKPLFHLIRSSTKIIEFDNVKYLKSISSEDDI